MNKKFKYLEKKFIAGGCSFTFGHELSDDNNGKSPSNKTWAYLLKDYATWFRPSLYRCTAQPGSGNSGIARRVYQALRSKQDSPIVVVMWSFPSRYDWAMPRHKVLENTRWTSITPWDTTQGQADAFRNLASSEPHKQEWKARRQHMKETGVGDFADALYKYAANEYHEIYTNMNEIYEVKKKLEKDISNFISTELEWIPENLVSLNGDNKDNMIKFLEALDDDDDVQNIFTNAKFEN